MAVLPHRPLDVDRHAADLFAAYALGDNSDWTWLASTRPESVAATAHWIAGKVNDDALVPYAVFDLRSAGGGHRQLYGDRAGNGHG